MVIGLESHHFTLTSIETEIMKNRTNDILAVGICMAFGVVTVANAKPPVDDLEATLNTKISELEARVLTLETNEQQTCRLYQTIIESPSSPSLDTADMPEFCADHLEPKIVFITSGRGWNGELGGISGADEKCQNAADAAAAAGMLPSGGQYKAWLATSPLDAPVSRFSHSITPYVLNDAIDGAGATIVANDWNDLVDGSLQNPISIDEYGGSVGNTLVWSNVTTEGTYEPSWSDYNCAGWIGSSNVFYGGLGRATLTDTGWTQASIFTCEVPYPLYCFQQ